MHFHRVHRRFAAWLAMCVMVLSALAPTFAQAMVAASGKGQWVEVCSASGMVWLKHGGADTNNNVAPGQDRSMADMGQHCPWCGLHEASVGMLAATVAVPVAAPAAQSVPEPVDVALARKVRRSAQARAPPFVA
jgi:hypothetical protein